MWYPSRALKTQFIVARPLVLAFVYFPALVMLLLLPHREEEPLPDGETREAYWTIPGRGTGGGPGKSTVEPIARRVDDRRANANDLHDESLRRHAELDANRVRVRQPWRERTRDRDSRRPSPPRRSSGPPPSRYCAARRTAPLNRGSSDCVPLASAMYWTAPACAPASAATWSSASRLPSRDMSIVDRADSNQADRPGGQRCREAHHAGP